MPKKSAISYVVSNRVATLTFDCKDEKVNKLSTGVLQELSQTLDAIAAESTLDILIINSAKPDVFIAGADINEIRDIQDAADGESKAKLGQSILHKIAQLKIPSIAIVHGAALGGGLELALACTYRIVTDHPKTVLGLPEVNLGIIPGFGGTQRLPKLIGLSRSLPIILTGKAIKGSQALKLGLADVCCSKAYIPQKLEELVATIKTKKGPADIRQRRQLKGLAGWFLDRSFLGKFIVLRTAEKQILTQTKGQYPAPLAALSAIRYGYSRSVQAGLNYEAKQFSQVVGTAISKNLITLFFAQEALKKDTGVATDHEGFSVHHTGVLGAGLMGGGVAYVLSESGLTVRLKDIAWDAISKGFAAAKKIVIKTKKKCPQDIALVMHRITGTIDYKGFEKIEVVIEAILEDMALKKNVFQELETHIARDTIVASNTSALSIAEMATAFKNPSRFIGMHFFSPVNKMPLVEVIPGPHTSPETIATIVKLAKSIKKTPIVVKDCPGFLINRILIPYVNEAVLLLQEGVDTHVIDEIMVEFGMPLGPLALADEVGLDVGYKVAKILELGYGSRMAVARAFDQVYVNSNLRGKKTGRGFYIHHEKSKTVNPDVRKLIGRPKGKRPKRQECLDRMILTMVNEAARCIDEQIVASPSYLDLGMIMGTGFPPFRGGLCRYADAIGIDTIVKKLDVLHRAYGARFEPAPRLVKMATENNTFY